VNISTLLELDEAVEEVSEWILPRYDGEATFLIREATEETERRSHGGTGETVMFMLLNEFLRYPRSPV
jgi:hypothetical protein